MSSSSPSDENRTEMKMGVEQWWSVTDGSEMNRTGENREGRQQVLYIGCEPRKPYYCYSL